MLPKTAAKAAAKGRVASVLAPFFLSLLSPSLISPFLCTSANIGPILATTVLTPGFGVCV